MNDTIRLGRVAGIPVGVHWSALVVGIAVTVLLALQILPSLDSEASWIRIWAAAAAGTGLFFASLLAHEFGHAIVARRHDVGVIGLTLWVLGGMAKLTRQAPTPRAEFQIAIAGPAANLGLGVVFGGAAWALRDTTDWRLVGAVCVWLAALNVLLGITNLAPGSPLDGGRVLAAFLWRRNGDAERSRLMAGRVGMVLGVVIVVAGMAERFWFGQNTGWWTMAVGVFIAGAAKSEIAAAAVRGRLASTSLATVMVSHPPSVPDGATAQQFLDWSLRQPMATATPVVRWDAEPLGYMTRSIAGKVGALERSWTSVGTIMLPAALAPRAWSFESVATVLDRLDVSLPTLVVVHDGRSHQAIGTVSDEQLMTLFAAPDWWGRERSAPPLLDVVATPIGPPPVGAASRA